MVWVLYICSICLHKMESLLPLRGSRILMAANHLDISHHLVDFVIVFELPFRSAILPHDSASLGSRIESFDQVIP